MYPLLLVVRLAEVLTRRASDNDIDTAPIESPIEVSDVPVQISLGKVLTQDLLAKKIPFTDSRDIEPFLLETEFDTADA